MKSFTFQEINNCYFDNGLKLDHFLAQLIKNPIVSNLSIDINDNNHLKITEVLEKNNFTHINKTGWYPNKHLYVSRPYLFLSEKENIILRIEYSSIDVFYDNEENINWLVELLEKHGLIRYPSKGKVNLIVHGGGGYSLIEKEIKLVEIKDYNDQYHLKNNIDLSKLVSILEKEGSGFILLTGEPGTGKSFLIKNFISIIDKKFVFIPSSIGERLDDPHFVEFAISRLQNCLLIIEDAEKLLEDRSYGNGAVRAILSITDGIYGDLLGIKVIATQNNTDKTDKALLRKGRLLFRGDFDLLPANKARKIAKKLKIINFKIKDGACMSLADIYNIDETGFDNNNKMGF